MIFETKQKPLLSRVKIQNSKNLPRPIEVNIEAILYNIFYVAQTNFLSAVAESANFFCWLKAKCKAPTINFLNFLTLCLSHLL
jgi:hypothetical protein